MLKPLPRGLNRKRDPGSNPVGVPNLIQFSEHGIYIHTYLATTTTTPAGGRLWLRFHCGRPQGRVSLRPLPRASVRHPAVVYASLGLDYGARPLVEPLLACGGCCPPTETATPPARVWPAPAYYLLTRPTCPLSADHAPFSDESCVGFRRDQAVVGGVQGHRSQCLERNQPRRWLW